MADSSACSAGTTTSSSECPFWNLHDGQSWLNKFPWARVNHPLLFDRQGQPKPAFTVVLKELAAPRPPGAAK